MYTGQCVLCKKQISPGQLITRIPKPGAQFEKLCSFINEDICNQIRETLGETRDEVYWVHSKCAWETKNPNTRYSSQPIPFSQKKQSGEDIDLRTKAARTENIYDEEKSDDDEEEDNDSFINNSEEAEDESEEEDESEAEDEDEEKEDESEEEDESEAEYEKDY